MRLVPPTVEFEESWWAAIQALTEEGTKGFWYVPEPPRDIASYIQRTVDNAKGENLADGWVAATTLWLVDGGEFIGHVNIRHELNDWLLKRGGNIGYDIAPAHRRKGYGTKLLTLALEKARELGIEKALVTCGDTNIASRKIIERAGGVLENVMDVNGEQVRRYWIQ
jgi:predicted acetyltransferase